MGYVKIKFPCGFEIETKSWAFYFGESDWRSLYEHGCPIHADKCK